MADPTIPMNKATTTLPLADVHLQDIPGTWPLAWGWWLCIIIGVIALSYLSRLLFRKIKQHRASKQAQHEAKQQLKAMAQTTQLGDINELLRKAALSYFPRQQVAGLTGQRWLSFLDQQLPPKQQGFLAYSDVWQQGLFSPNGLSEDELMQCKKLASNWIIYALPPKPNKHVTDNASVDSTSASKQEQQNV